MSEVKVEITANSSALATGLAKAQKNIQSFGKDVTTNITDKLAGAFTGGAVIAGIGALAAGVLVAGKSIMEFAGNLQDTSEQLGVTVEDLQGLHAAFRGGGASSDDVDKAMVKLTENMDAASKSAGPARDRFDQLGISFEQITSGDPKAVLLAFGDAVKNSKNPTETLAAVIDLLGKSGKKLVPDLKQGSEALQELSDKADKLANKDADAIAKFGDAVDVLKNKMMALGATAATPLFSELNAAMDETTPKLSRFARIASMLQSSTTLGGFITNAVSGVLGGKKAEAPKPEEFLGPTMDQLTAPVIIDPKVKANLEETAKIKEQEFKAEQEYNAQLLKEAEKLGDLQIKNAQDAEDARRSQLTVEEEINALLSDRKNLESEVANSKGEQQAQAQKDLQDVQKLLAAKIDARDADARSQARDQMAMDAENAKKVEDHKKKIEEIAGAEKKAAEDIAKATKESKKKEAGIIGTMAEEEMKTPMQRANEDRIAREKKRIERSIERRIEKGALSGTSSNAMQKLKGELDENRKDLPKEVAKLTDELKIAVKKLNAA
jgi:hypothetical protein